MTRSGKTEKTKKTPTAHAITITRYLLTHERKQTIHIITMTDDMMRDQDIKHTRHLSRQANFITQQQEMTQWRSANNTVRLNLAGSIGIEWEDRRYLILQLVNSYSGVLQEGGCRESPNRIKQQGVGGTGNVSDSNLSGAQCSKETCNPKKYKCEISKLRKEQLSEEMISV